MAQVNVTINGRSYRMACGDGEEEHLGELADYLDRTIERLRGEFGEIGDYRLTVMAAITLADERAEAGRQIQVLKESIAAMERDQEAGVEHRRADEAEIARSVDAVAERVEALAERLSEAPRRENSR